MPVPKVIVGAHEFIGSGSFLLQMHERAQIFPFDDNLYSFYLNITIDPAITDHGGWTSKTDLTPMEIHITRPWLFGSNVLSYGVGIAQSENELIFMALNSHVFGDIDSHAIFASYTIYKRNK